MIARTAASVNGRHTAPARLSRNRMDGPAPAVGRSRTHSSPNGLNSLAHQVRAMDELLSRD
jgi:hypothetical protein